MSKKIIVKGCPLCGEAAYWRKGNLNTRMLDGVQCPNCFLEIEGSYEPQSAVHAWNVRVLEHIVKDSVYNIDGGQIE